MVEELKKKKTKKSYDRRVKFMVRKGLLPDIYRKQISRGLISKWKREAPPAQCAPPVYVGFSIHLEDDWTAQKLIKRCLFSHIY